MGDRTSYTLIMDMADLSEKRVAKIVDRVFDGCADEVYPEDGRIADYERSIGDSPGMADELARMLVKWGKDRPFRLWEDPKYEWLGTVVIHRPGEPMFEANCDADGDVVLTTRVIRSQWARQSDADFIEWLRVAIGPED